MELIFKAREYRAYAETPHQVRITSQDNKATILTYEATLQFKKALETSRGLKRQDILKTFNRICDGIFDEHSNAKIDILA